MKRQSEDAQGTSAQLENRIKGFYGHFNCQQWQACFDSIDPELRQAQRIEYDAYSEGLSSFFEKYGPIAIQSLTLSVHLDVKNAKHDTRDFANGVVAWLDRQGHAHQFKERWVRADDDNWYTRMIGLV